MCFIDALPTNMDASGASELRQREVEDAQGTTGATEPILGRVDDNPTALETKYVMELRRSPTRAELRAEAAGQLKAVLVAKGYKRSTLSGLDRDELVDLVLPLLDPDNAYFDDAPLPLGSGQEKGDSTYLQRECAARARFGHSTHASRALREMIARPKNQPKRAENDRDRSL
jgi:hypothetical protein